MSAQEPVFVLLLDPSVESTRAEVLARLRHPEGDGLHTAHWRFEAISGEVLAERRGADLTIHGDVCKRLLGEEP